MITMMFLFMSLASIFACISSTPIFTSLLFDSKLDLRELGKSLFDEEFCASREKGLDSI